MARYVAFLRAINTPPRHVKMDRLRATFEDLGLQNVATFIASGNVIFDTDRRQGLAGRIEAALHHDLGFEVPVYLRTRDEVIAVADCRPFGDRSGQAEVSFLPAAPDPAAVESLLATAGDDDRLAVIGREVYWHHPGHRSESTHSEATVVRILRMPTTRRSSRTVARIANEYLR
jgi:uncharacterized protein (DUF1697 family)